jgi:hypothetical protein
LAAIPEIITTMMKKTGGKCFQQYALNVKKKHKCPLNPVRINLYIAVFVIIK